MLIGGSLLLHGERYAETVDDLPTLRHIERQLRASVANHRAIAASIADPGARAEFEAVFADDIARCERVIATCSRRLEEARKDLLVNEEP